MKQVLVIDRECGCGASTVAYEIAQRLDWELFHHDVAEEAARLAQLFPAVRHAHGVRLDSCIHRAAQVLRRGGFERPIQPNCDLFDSDRLVALEQEIIERAADNGHCVIVGRGAPYYLRDRPDVFSVFLYAPRDIRFHRILQRVHDESRAAALVVAMDEKRRKFTEHYFGCDWGDRHFFDLMLNTELGCDTVVELILRALELANRCEDPTG
jgi:cytidylate kinase